MNRLLILFNALILTGTLAPAQTLQQTVRGQIRDAESRQVIFRRRNQTLRSGRF
ncbi:MAG: hypothetical protein AAF998_23725 [Bacteroidota bacterium]